ncbi:hypothetical protein QA612_15130 [Evansella sp. AB-P1]|uniref:hypothetical protein n=1 Tax=Evansella sp. AB-P1 TaxID=3037653 RepID=UPI00241D188E|nr:hypothetical protein [Evansella sp. AB-P1]MDG5788803.1 hypothetical protein [Evansella sp. AB-P1]
MRSIILIISVVYFLSLLPIATFIYFKNKREPQEEKMNMFLWLLVSIILAFPPTVVIAFFLLVLLGTTNIVDMLFSLELSMNQLIMLTISILVYLFTLDSVIEKLVKYMTEKNKFYLFIVLLTRIIAFHLIGMIIGLNQANSLVISTGVALIIMILEVLYHYQERHKG